MHVKGAECPSPRRPGVPRPEGVLGKVILYLLGYVLVASDRVGERLCILRLLKLTY